MSGIDYTNIDYKGFKNAMVETLQQRIPEYTDTSETDAGMVILEAVAKVMDVLSYYQNAQANECFLVTADLRSSVVKFAKMLDYTPRSCTPAKYKQHFIIKKGAGAVTIPSGTIIRTQEKSAKDSINFTTLEELSIYADDSCIDTPYFVDTVLDDSNEITGYIFELTSVHGVLINNEVIGVGDGATESLKFSLKNSPVCLPDYDEDGYGLVPHLNNDSNKIVPNDYDPARDFVLRVSGAKWTLKNSFVDSTAISNDYTVEVEQDNTVTVIFGDGVNGCIPFGEITVSYRQGGGTVGNVGAKTITVPLSRIQGVVETYNPDLPYSAGTDKESITEIKMNAPTAYRTKWGCVQFTDYADKVRELFPQIKLVSSFPKTYKERPNFEVITEELLHIIDTVQICVLPKEDAVDEYGNRKSLEDYGKITDLKYTDLRTYMYDRLEERSLIGTFIELIPFESKGVILNCTLLPSVNYTFEEVEGKVREYITNYFTVGNLMGGQTVSLNELEADVYAGIEGIRAFRINYFSVGDMQSNSLDISSELWEIIELEGLEILNTRGDTSG